MALGTLHLNLLCTATRRLHNVRSVKFETAPIQSVASHKLQAGVTKWPDIRNQEARVEGPHAEGHTGLAAGTLALYLTISSLT